MASIHRFTRARLLVIGLALVPVLAASGCADAQEQLCCTEFKAGASVTAEIGGSAQAQVAAQAVADVTGIAQAAIEDLTTACRGIATDLGAAPADQDAANAQTDKNEQMKSWCTAAAHAIASAKATAGVSLALDVKPPKCEASFSAKANCQAKCSGSARCDVSAEPPTCSGGPGSLSISCKGECNAEATATVKCEGSCTAQCKGSCTAKGGVAVKCDGKCEGTCAADAAGGTSSGLQADGTCKGTCSGTCTARAEAPSLECSGACNGECTGTCKAAAGASVTCNGKCSTPDFAPLRCEGGELKGGCKVEASCDANCDASVSAKAECTPPDVTISLHGAADVDAGAKLKATLEKNLPLVLALAGKVEGMLRVGKNLTSSASVSAVAELKASCVVAIGAAAAHAVTADLPDAASAVASIQATLN
jgi:hypothetical protein